MVRPPFRWTRSRERQPRGAASATGAVSATATGAVSATGVGGLLGRATGRALGAGRTTGGPGGPAALAEALLRRLGLPLGAVGRDVALVDPDLDADPAERRPGLVEAVVDVRAQRVQGDAALAVELRARHLRATETTGALHPDALGAGLHRRLHRLAHGAAERHPAGQLLGDPLGHQLGVHLGVLDLEDVQLDLLAGELLEVAADAVGLGAATADDDAGTGRVDVHADPVTGALDLHLGDPGALHALAHHASDGHVFLDVVLVHLVGVPPALEVGGDAEPEPVRVDLLAH